LKTVLFGGTGFIGSHVAEQLLAAGHEVKAAVRATSDSRFLQSIGAEVVPVNFADSESLVAVMQGSEVVYNCTAHPRIHETLERLQQVEVELTRTLVRAAAQAGVKRLVQLSTILVYDFNSSERLNEKSPSSPRYTFQQVCLQRERIVLEEGKRLGLETYILRPPSAIGRRDRASHFSALYRAHKQNKYPMIGSGEAAVSFIDTRDIGRAMEWLGRIESRADDDGIYLAKGFDTTWLGLKQYLDKRLDFNAKIQRVPAGLAHMLAIIMEKFTPYSSNPMLVPLSVKFSTTPRLADDGKIRNTGFVPKYSLEETVEDALKFFQEEGL